MCMVCYNASRIPGPCDNFMVVELQTLDAALDRGGGSGGRGKEEGRRREGGKEEGRGREGGGKGKEERRGGKGEGRGREGGGKGEGRGREGGGKGEGRGREGRTKSHFEVSICADMGTLWPCRV